MIDLEKHDGVFVMRMRSGENRLNLDFVGEWNRALDQVESSTEPTALVTIGEGKFYSNGLDLDWMAGPGRDQAILCVKRVHQLLGRLLSFPVITVCASNGHCFAAGAMLALAHDYRVMRTDRGYFCLPEVDIQIPFTPPMAALIQARLPKNAAHEAMVTGKRYTAEQAQRAGIVHEVAAEDAVLPAALALAKAHAGKQRATVAAIKRVMYQGVLDTIAREA
ncbi:MAG TPA: enoyl-CoA hydratase/isomerase family protein [Polyangiales bacterium]